MIRVPREICVDVDRALTKEWLVANGIGGYASSTVAGVDTRRYHGLLVAALKPPVERTLLFAKIDEEATIDERTYYLGANEYPDGKLHPDGYVHIEEFTFSDNIATTVFCFGDALLHKTVWMEHGHNTTYVRYTYVKGVEGVEGECRLALHLLCNYRDYHGLTKGNLEWNFGVDSVEGGCKITATSDAHPFWLTTAPLAEFTHTGVWYWNFVYRAEIARGYNDTEDLYAPGILRATLQPGQSLTVTASTEPPEQSALLAGGALEREQARQRALLKAAGLEQLEEVASGELLVVGEEQNASLPTTRNQQPATSSTSSTSPANEAFVAQLVSTADTFMVTRTIHRDGEAIETPSVLAGYHWFTDWGRDTMISLPGLTLPTGRSREAGRVLQTFGLFARNGLIPNYFPDVGEAPEYNTADATLWMFATAEKLAQGRGNITVISNLYPLLADIIAWQLRGTDHGIRVDPQDGLLMAGEEGVQLTWMDAKVDDWVVTPRRGKPVEINALWYNALRVMATLRVSLGRTVVRGGHEELPDFNALAEQVRTSFRRRFWYDAQNYLFDVIDGPDGNDPAIRPNQILAVSLNADLLSGDQARHVLSTVREHLLTPYGLRSLSPQNPHYEGRYTGDRRERDRAYHNGTVWAWLLGPYFDAVRNVEGAAVAGNELRMLLPTLHRHLGDAGLGSVSEIFDGDAPHEPKGCISQAWSVAEILRHVWGPEKLI